MAQKLNQQSLSKLASSVSVPKYDRSALTAGIIHIGVGNFHRAHQAVYLQNLFNLGLDHDWAIIGAGIKSNDKNMRDALEQQDWLTTIVELDPDGYTASINGAMIDFIEVNNVKLIEALAEPKISIVSLTITEGGYFVDSKNGSFDIKHPEIVQDIKNQSNPQTVFGIMIAALKIRRANNIQPFTILSCDNLPENGKAAKQTTLGLARAISEELADWLEDNVAFPNSMVDCITPATGPRERALIADKFKIDDASPVACEPFRQWVLEDNFPSGRPQLEKVGVQFVPDVAPYELMKLRILNGGHAAIAYPAALLGEYFVHDAMNNPLISDFLHKLTVQEIIPTIPPVPGVNFAEYLASIEHRFSNEMIGDTIDRLCLDGSNRQPKFILPVISERLKSGLPINGLALEVALWCRYCAGTDNEGNYINLVDEKADQLHSHAIRAKSNPIAFLEMREIFGDLSNQPEFVDSFAHALNSIWQNGTAATLKSYLQTENQTAITA